MTTPNTRNFLCVVDWEDYQYSGSHKKPDPPWRWCRLPRTLLDSPEFQCMTHAQRGAFCWLLMLASETGNLIPDEPKYLRHRMQLDPRLRLSLIEVGLIEQIALPSDSPQIKKLRRMYSGATQSPEGEGEGETDIEKTPIRPRANPEGNGTDQPRSPEYSENPVPPSPPRPDVRSVINGIGREMRTSSSGSRRRNGNDPRSFDELKAAITDVSQRLGTTDRDQIWKLASQRLQMSERQFSTAFDQLTEDGKL